MIYRHLAKRYGLVLQCKMRLFDGLYVTFTSRRSANHATTKETHRRTSTLISGHTPASDTENSRRQCSTLDATAYLGKRRFPRGGSVICERRESAIVRCTK